MQFTPSQRRALALDRHLGITANAGSGKTRVLVERYVSILEQDESAHPRNIVAITFTEASAAELKSRIVAEIERRIENAQSRAHRRRLEQIRSDLKGSYIGTIHSFATRLLRAYPVEANVDAAFGVISGAEEKLLQEDVIASVFYAVLSEAYSDKSAAETEFLRIFRLFGRRELTEYMRSCFGNRSRVRTLRATLLAQSDAEVIAFWESRLSELCEVANGPEQISDLHAIVSAGKKGAQRQKAETALVELASARSLFARMVCYKAVIGTIFTQDGPPRKNLLPDDVRAGLEALIEGVQARHELIGKLLELLPDTEEALQASHLAYLRDLRTVFELWDMVFQEFTERKNLLSVLDFEDLIERAEKLLTMPLIRDELVDRFRYIMIDEYQDTDEAQFRIAKSLTDGFAQRNRLAVVGDPKQSIYTFRNADATVFRTTLEHIAEQESAFRHDAVIALQENFRMLERPLAFVNKIFDDVMQPKIHTLATEEVDHEPLVLGRASVSPGGVELLLCNTGVSDATQSEDDAEDAEESDEFTLLARKIQTVVRNEEYAIDDNGTMRLPEYKDIAILLRARTQLPELEAALRTEGVPYVVRKGSGFFQQQEILDVISYLKFLLSSADDVALLGILRSPFFALDDTLLFQIAYNTRSKPSSTAFAQSFWDRLQAYAATLSEVPPLLERALRLIDENLKIVGRVPIARLIEKIYRDSAIYAIHSAGPNGQQRVANLKKMLTLARSADASGFSTLFDFVERLDYLTSEPGSEAQADTAGDEPAVQITTVHGAKGLEYPIVFAASLHKQFNFDRVRILDKELGLMVTYPSDDSRVRKPLIAELIRLRSDANTVAEEKRVLYVQLTRARDYLVCSGTLGKRQSKQSALQWVLHAVAPTLTIDQDLGVSMKQPIGVYTDGEVISKEIACTIPITTRLESKKGDALLDDTHEPFVLENTLLAPVHPGMRHDRFSATQLLTYEQCPTKYFLAYGLGIPEEPKLAYDIQPDEISEKVRGALTGQVIHKLLERVHRWAPGGSLNTELFDEDLSVICTSLGIVQANELAAMRKRALADVTNFVTSEFGRFVMSCRQATMELPIQTQINAENTLYGVLDRLFQEPDGTWHILDYKTDAHPGRNEEKYQRQLGFYALLVSRLYKTNGAVKSTLFYTRTGKSATRIHTPDELASTELSYQEIIDRIRIEEKIDELSHLPRNTDHCADCNYFNAKTKACVVPG